MTSKRADWWDHSLIMNWTRVRHQHLSRKVLLLTAFIKDKQTGNPPIDWLKFTTKITVSLHKQKMTLQHSTWPWSSAERCSITVQALSHSFAWRADKDLKDEVRDDHLLPELISVRNCGRITVSNNNAPIWVIFGNLWLKIKFKLFVDH